MQLQTIRVRGVEEEYVVDQMEYPFVQMGVVYVRLVVYRFVEGEYTPTDFLVVMPQDILTREMLYDQVFFEEMQLAAAEANARDAEYTEQQQSKPVEPEQQPPAPETQHPPEGGDPEGMFG